MNKRYSNLLIIILFVTIITAGYATGRVARHLALYRTSNSMDGRISSLNEMIPGSSAKATSQGIDFGPMDTFLTVLRLVRKNYVDKISDDYNDHFALSAVENMLASLKDPYSRLVQREQREVLAATADGDYQGIGVVLGARQRTEEGTRVQKLAVVTPIPGGPADKAGLLPGDIILKINGKKVVEVPAEGRLSQGMKDLIDRLRKEAEKNRKEEEKTTPPVQTPEKKERKPEAKPGTKTTPDKPASKPVDETEVIFLHDAMDSLTMGSSGSVTLTIERQGAAAPLTIKVTRARTHVNPVETRLIGKGILYVRVLHTSDTAVETFRTALKDPANAGVNSIILDLRRSPGGQLDPMLELAGNLIPGQPVAVLAKRGSKEPVRAVNAESLKADKLIVLVDKGTASTSEILAAALRDKARARIVGTTTFGDTLVQSVMPLSDGSAVILTTGKLLPVSGTDLNGTGLKPDVSVAGKPTGSEKDDAALQKAVALTGS